MKNAFHGFPEIKGDEFKLLVLSNKKEKSSKSSHWRSWNKQMFSFFSLLTVMIFSNIPK